VDLQELLDIGEQERAGMPPVQIRCCSAAGCLSAGADKVIEKLQQAVAQAGQADQVRVCSVGCLRLCGQGPLVQVAPHGPMYQKVTADNAGSIVAGMHAGDVKAERLNTGEPFFALQASVVLENSGVIEPERIESYIAVNGYQALEKAVSDMEPQEVIEEITRSGLRGRGGAGYPTGLKWATVAKHPSAKKYIVCNADEGDPGAFMNRSVLESDPHRVLEGMAIAGYAVGAQQGFIYVRGEYPLAIERLKVALKQASQRGLLGARLFGTPLDFRIDIRIGAGAFVCGEETALMASIMGERGYPRPRPPYPAESGLWGCPTLLNNVETFANIAPIIQRGAAWFASMGTERSKGTKVFSVTGKVKNTGLVEVPLGTTMRTIVETIAGGVPTGTIKAVQTGGPSGGCISAEHLDTPVDYESLQSLGSIMGSGGMIVMDQDNSMVDVARFYMTFCMEESCGECIPCRVGTVQMTHLLTKILDGKANHGDLKNLEELCDMVRHTSLCGLGQTAPNPVLSTLRFFRHEYEALLNKAEGDSAWRRGLPVVHLVR
jgi:bidirectional [NiFe] hydrogenase diaphorase subunit